MNNPDIVNVTFLSKWEEGNVETAAKLNVITGRVFDIASVKSENEHLIGELILIEGDETEYPVETNDDNEYFVTNQVLRERISRVCEFEVDGVLMSRPAFERRMEADDDLSIPGDRQVRIVASGRTVCAGDLMARLTGDAMSFLNRRIEFDAMIGALGEFLSDVDYNDPQSQLAAIAENDEDAMAALDVAVCETYENYPIDTLLELIESAISSQKESLQSIADLALRLSRGGAANPRVLVVVSGGIAEIAADDSADVHVFDRDDYRDAEVQDRADMAVPKRFRDLAEQLKVPVEGDKAKGGMRCKP